MRIISFSPVPMQAFWTAPVQALVPWITRIKASFLHGPVRSVACRSTAGAASSFLTHTAAASNDAFFKIRPEFTESTRFAMPQESPRSVLRIVRESDAAIRPDCAGRMVISGRMADVCAELDRMAMLAEPAVAD